MMVVCLHHFNGIVLPDLIGDGGYSVHPSVIDLVDVTPHIPHTN